MTSPSDLPKHAVLSKHAVMPGALGYAESVATMTGPGTPDLVVRPSSTGEVREAVLYAGARGLPLAVRAGGHSMAGLTRVPDGVLVDLRSMDDVEVDAATRRVRIGGGATWGHVAQQLRPAGLALTAGDTAGVGVGGLTLGGGIGWMVRRYGLAIDSLVGAQVVTADGRVLEVSGDERPELFWALRGGGGGFGVVTRFDFVAHPVPDVVFGTVFFDLTDPAAALPLLRAWRAHQHGADDRLTSVLSMLPAMGDQPPVAMLQLCFEGDEAAAAGVIDPLLTLGSALSRDVGVRPYAEILVSADHPPAGRVAQRNTLLRELGEAESAAVTELLRDGRSMLSVRALGGAFARVASQATAFAHRDAEVMVAVMRMLDEQTPSGQEDVPGWTAVEHRGLGSYANFLDAAGPDEAAACYPEPTLRRLARVKAEYDPRDVFNRCLPVASE